MPLRGAIVDENHVAQTVLSAVCGFFAFELAQSRRPPWTAGGLRYKNRRNYFIADDL